MFVDPMEFHKGYGLALMKAIEEAFQNVNKYCLESDFEYGGKII